MRILLTTLTLASFSALSASAADAKPGQAIYDCCEVVRIIFVTCFRKFSFAACTLCLFVLLCRLSGHVSSFC